MSTAAIPVHVALVDASGTIDHSELAEVAGALNEQVQADFTPVWKVAATVGAYPSAPAGTWRIELQEGIDQRGAAGYHADDHHQPYSKVDLTAGNWTVTASHELLEMLGDPWGSRLHTAAALPGWSGKSKRVRYLVELADPCEAFNYPVGGVPVSDFLLPVFYRSSKRAVAGYSHTGSLTQPLEVADGGYITFLDPETGDVWQRFVEGGRTEDKNYGPQQLGAKSLREWADDRAREYRESVRGS
jgi:hypothetical protein